MNPVAETSASVAVAGAADSAAGVAATAAPVAAAVAVDAEEWRGWVVILCLKLSGGEHTDRR